jgi:hypothetical protein
MATSGGDAEPLRATSTEPPATESAPAATATPASALDAPAIAEPSPSDEPTISPPLVSSQPVNGLSSFAPAPESGEEEAPAPSEEPSANEPPPPAYVPGDTYCGNITGTAPPNSVIGQFTIAGAPAPAGTVVALAFDGVPGPSRATPAAGGYRVDYSGGSSGCANQVGAAISVIYAGTAYSTGHTVGDSPGVPVVFHLNIP